MSAVAAPARPVAEQGPAPLNKPYKRWTRFILPTYTILMIVYLASPIFVMILYGFNDVPFDRQNARFWGFTLDWWKNFLGFPGLGDAFKNSLKIAPISAAVATTVGTLFGLALGRYRFRGLRGIDFVIFLAIAVPEIVLGSSLLSMFVLVDVPLGFTTIILSHIGFSIAFVAVTVRARVQGLDRNLEDAAQDLFASPVAAFFKVTLPLIAPGHPGGVPARVRPVAGRLRDHELRRGAGDDLPALGVRGAADRLPSDGERDGNDPVHGRDLGRRGERSRAAPAGPRVIECIRMMKPLGASQDFVNPFTSS